MFVYRLSLGKSAYTFYVKKTDSTHGAQSYHIHQVESVPLEPNTPTEVSQGGGRPTHEPQQRENSKKSRRQNDDMAE